MNTTQDHSTTEDSTTHANAARQDPGRARTPALRRPTHGRMLAGVASGLADYLGADVTLIRIAMIVALFVGGVGLPLYLAGWLLMPDEAAGRSLASDFAADVQSWRE